MKNLYSLIFFVCALLFFSSEGSYAQNTFTIGDGIFSNGSNDFPAPYGQYYTGARQVFIYRKQELIDSGWTTPRLISQLGFNVTSVNGAGPHMGFTIKMKFSPINTLSAFPSGMTVVYSSSAEQPTFGWNMKTLQVPMIWDPTKGNIIVEVCFSNGTWNYSENASTEMTFGLPSGSSYGNWGDDAGNGCSDNSPNRIGPSSGSTDRRPNIRFATQPLTSMTYDSSWAESIDEFSYVGKSNQKIMKLVVSTTGVNSPLSVTDLSFNSGMSTDPTGDIASAKVYYTKGSDEFSTSQLVGTATGPNGSYSVPSSLQLNPGQNYFWLVYDLKSTAAEGNVLDAEFTGMTVGGIVQVPTITAPTGIIPIGRMYDFETNNSQGFRSVNEGPGLLNEWQRGVPQNGPPTVNSGMNCWGTGLSSNSSAMSDYSLISPPMIITDTMVNMVFSQWFDFLDIYNDIYADLDVQINNGGWSPLYSIDVFSIGRATSRGEWERISTGLTTTINDTIQFRWRFQTGPWTVATSGWFIDDLAISGVNDLSQYYVSANAIQIEGAFDVRRPNIAVMKVEIETEGTQNPLDIQNLEFNTTGSTSGIIDNAKLFYTGVVDRFDSTVQFGSTVTLPSGSFNFLDSIVLHSGKNYFWLVYNINSSANINDKIDAECNNLIIGLTPYTPDDPMPAGYRSVGRSYNFDTASSQGFVAGAIDNSQNEWQRGIPLSGPMAAASGTICWGTNLTGPYSPASDYYFQTPRYIATETQVDVTYDNWYDLFQLYNSLDATFEYSINGGTWTNMGGVDNNQLYKSAGWEEVRTNVSVSIGDTVQFRWHFLTSWGIPSSGWYIDNVSIAGISEMNQVFQSATAVQSYTTIEANEQNVQVLRVEVEMDGSINPLDATMFNFNTANSVNGIIADAKFYATGNVNVFSTNNMIGTAVTAPSGPFSFSGTVGLLPGTNYFWLVYSLNGAGMQNDSVDAEFTDITIDALSYSPLTSAPDGMGVIGLLYDFDTTSNQAFTATIDPYAGTETIFERGAPTIGPAAFSGNTCWGTDLDDVFKDGTRTSLFTDAYVVKNDIVGFGFKQWFDFGRIDNSLAAYFDYSVNGGGWNTVYQVDNSIASSSQGVWQNISDNLSATAGDTIQFRWYFEASGGWWWPLTLAEGWYIDNFIVSGVEKLTQTYVSSTASQNERPMAAGSINQPVLRIEVDMLGSKDPLTIDGLSFNTAGSSPSSTLITDAKLFFTGTSDKFDTVKQYGTTFANPSGSFTFTGSDSLEMGKNYFWLTYSIEAGALLGDSVDAEFTSLIVGGLTQTPVEIAPAGNKKTGILYDFEALDNQGFFAQSNNGRSVDWQRGVPANPTYNAFSGTHVWKTNLNGPYAAANDEDYSLFSPVFVATSEQVALTFMHAINLPQCCDYLEVYYQVNNGGYTLLYNYDRSTNKWKTSDDISFGVNVGDIVQFQWRIVSYQKNNNTFEGWMIDDVIVSGVEEAPMSIISADVSQNEEYTAAGFNQQTVLGVNVIAEGSGTPLVADYFRFNTTGSTDPADIVSAKLYFSGNSRELRTDSLFGTAVPTPNGTFIFTGSQPLVAGYNHFWLVYDIADSAAMGNLIDAGIDSVGVSGVLYEPSDIAPAGARTITLGYTFEGSRDQGFKADFEAEAKQWERGVPLPGVAGGPTSAYGSLKCWGTNLSGNYDLLSTYSLISPSFIANSSDIEVAYKEFYNIYSSDCGTNAEMKVDVNINNGGWIEWTSSSNGTSLGWETMRINLTNGPGDTIVLRWRFSSAGYCTPQAGWYIDDMTFSDVTEIDLDAPVISYTPLTNTATLANRVLANFAHISDDFSGVDTTSFPPRIYYKKTSEMDVFGPNSNTADGWKYAVATNMNSPFSFTIDYSLLSSPLAIGDVIQYFVVAQDASPAALVGALPSEGFIGTSVDAVTSAPYSMNEYSITNVPLSGTYNVGSGQVYTSITAATKDLGIRGMNGGVTFALTDNNYSSGETFPIVIGDVAGASAINTITIKPTIAGTIISGNSPVAIFQFDNAKYATLNGAVVGSSKDLTLENTNPSTGSVVMFSGSGTLGSQHNTLMNTMIKGGQSGNTRGITIEGTGNGTGSGYNNISVVNNSIFKVNSGIYISGRTTSIASSTSILDNFIGSSSANERIKYSGIEMYNANGVTIKGNTLYNFFDNLDAGIMAISVNFGSANINIEGNKIDSMTSMSYNNGIAGILLRPENQNANITVVNNFVGRLYAKNDFVGIRVDNSTGNVKLYHNTVSISGEYAGFPYATQTVALFMDGNNINADIRNNIFHNSYKNTSWTNAISYSVKSYNDPSMYSFIDYNNYSVSGPQGILASFNNGNRANLSAIQAATTRDANSSSDPIFFVSSGDLHLAGASIGNVNLKATPLAAVPLDIDGQIRNPITPYKGADENAVSLPVKLTSFIASKSEATVILKWTTASEINNSYFVIERSVDMRKFEAIGQVKGKGNSNVPTAYTFIDKAAKQVANKGIIYYRLRQVDFNGTADHSDVRAVNFNEAVVSAFTIYPNPFVQTLNFNVTSTENAVMKITISDIQGRTLVRGDVTVSEGTNLVTFDGAASLSQGIYIIRTELNGVVNTSKLIKADY